MGWFAAKIIPLVHLSLSSWVCVVRVYRDALEEYNENVKKEEVLHLSTGTYFDDEFWVWLRDFIDIRKGLWGWEDYWPESSLFLILTQVSEAI